MKTYALNIVVGDNDNLVTTYDSLGKLRTLWPQDARDYLIRQTGPDYNTLGNGVTWYPYFTCENENGDIRELSFTEIRPEVNGGAA
jgi:hypothetical protein